MTSLRFLLCLVALLAPLVRADACSVPVFRYALERWRSSPYEVLVYHRGKLPHEQKQQIDQLEDRRTTCNIDVTTVDLNKTPEPELKRLWEKLGKDQPLPWVAIRYPGSLPETPLLMSGSLEQIRDSFAFDTPLRSQLIKHLGNGETGVVVLLKGSDESRNAQVRQMLQTEILRLERTIQLPDQSSEGPQIETNLPLKVSFPLLEVDRSDAVESLSIRMLLQTEDDLKKTDGPIVFLVFGRGRVLCGLHDDQINPDEFEHALRFLCGKCSCQIKELNPGMDLLVTADWEKILSAPPVEATPKAESIPEPTIENQPEARAVSSSGRSRVWMWIALVIAVAVMILSGIWMVRRNRVSE